MTTETEKKYDHHITGNFAKLNKFVRYCDFEANDNILIESQTGTGKTTTIIDLSNRYLTENKGYSFISVIAKRSLGIQHLEMLKSKFNNSNKTYYYKDVKNDEIKEKSFNLIVCINSLPKFMKYINPKKTVLFIDEISIFCKELTHNSTLDNILKQAYGNIKHLINNCKKLIVCQSKIDANVPILMNNRGGKLIKYINEFKGNFNKQCDIYEDNEQFESNMKQDIINNNPFLCSFDSKTQCDIYYALFKNMATDEQINKSFVISKDSQYEARDYEDCYVFYTPSIIYGIDFNFEEFQNQYVHITGNTINSDMIYQQAMRTRKIRKLIVKYENIKNQKRKYESLEDCKNQIIKRCQSFGIMHNMTHEYNEFDEYVFKETSFLPLYIHNEYQIDALNCNLKESFEYLLRHNGFIINKIETKNTSTKIKQEKQKLKSDIYEEKTNAINELMEDLTNDSSKLNQTKCNRSILQYLYYNLYYNWLKC